MRASWLRCARASWFGALFLALAGCTAFLAKTPAALGANPILFVTQVAQPTEVNDTAISNVFLGIGAGFDNHLGSTLYAQRGGDLWLGKPIGSITNLRSPPRGA